MSFLKTVYIDSVFSLNTITNFFLFLITARLAGIPLRRKRYLFAAIAGGGYAVIVFLPNCHFLAAAPIKCAVGVLLCLLAFGYEEKIIRLTFLFFIVSCGFAGCVLAFSLLAGQRTSYIYGIFYTDINIKILLISATVVWLLLTFSFHAAVKHRIEGHLLKTRICIFHQIIELTALHDSGNALQDCGQPVLVIAPDTLMSVMPENIRTLLTRERLVSPAEILEPLLKAAPSLHPRLISYRAVGKSFGLLLTIESEWIEIGGQRYFQHRLALCPTELGEEYKALWGGAIGKGGSNGYSEKVPSTAHSLRSIDGK